MYSISCHFHVKKVICNCACDLCTIVKIICSPFLLLILANKRPGIDSLYSNSLHRMSNMNFLLNSLVCVAWKKKHTVSSSIWKSKGWLEFYFWVNYFTNVLATLVYMFSAVFSIVRGRDHLLKLCVYVCVWESIKCCFFCLHASIHYFQKSSDRGPDNRCFRSPWSAAVWETDREREREMCYCELTHSPNMKFVPVSVISKEHLSSFQGLLGNWSDATCSRDRERRCLIYDHHHI